MFEVYNIAWQGQRDTAVALGYFDGVHIAHQYLISQMCEYAEQHNLDKGVFTFTKSVTLGHKGKDLYTRAQKLEYMRNLGIDLYYSPDFYDFSSFTPEEFVDNILIKSMRAKAVFCGENFFFGKNRRGNVQVLKELCEKNGIVFCQADTVTLNGETVSSTAIRKALEEGDVEKVNTMLGRPYTINLRVIKGKRIGRTLGTPTINQVYPDSMCMPKVGVYVSATNVDGKRYPSATGISTRPTVDGVGITCETFILGFSGDLYYKEVEVELYYYLYPPKKFESLAELGVMISSSAAISKSYLEEKGLI